MNDRELIGADQVVLALGNPPPGDPLRSAQRDGLGRCYVRDPWSETVIERCAPDEAILRIGTGLTMVDFALILKARGHRAPMYALSRHGLLPHPHRNPPRPPVLIDTPFQVDRWDGRVFSLLRWIRRTAQQTGEWREAVNSLRADTPTIWAQLADDERGRFLRHLRAYWDVHRHRMAMEIHLALQAMIDSGALAIVKWRLSAVALDQDTIMARIQLRGAGVQRTIRVAKIVNCTGPESDWSRVENPLIEQMLRDGLLVCDRHRLGICTDSQGCLIDRVGGVSRRLFALGNLRRGELWESTAVPELREQVSALADHLLRDAPRDNTFDRVGTAGAEGSVERK